MDAKNQNLPAAAASPQPCNVRLDARGSFSFAVTSTAISTFASGFIVGLISGWIDRDAWPVNISPVFWGATTVIWIFSAVSVWALACGGMWSSQGATAVATPQAEKKNTEDTV